MKKTSCSANAFGPGKDLVGKKHKGNEIISATRKYMTLKDGSVVERKGNKVEYEYDETAPVIVLDDSETEGDRF